jgi:hypothetical protein
MIFNAGLIIINIAWAVQLYQVMVKKDFTVSVLLPVLYGTGCILLITGNFIFDEITTGILNSICLALIMMLVVVLLTKKPKR